MTPPPWIDAHRAEGEPLGPALWPTLPRDRDGAGTTQVAGVQRRDWALVTARVQDARSLSQVALREAVRAAYLELDRRVRDGTASHPVRFWNYIPDIHGDLGSGLSRYMVFNAGRFHAMDEIHGGQSGFERHVATATGVGHAGPDLLVHCLATSEPGDPVENPRQIPAYRYSTRHGPIPPCFARATRASVAGRSLLLVGGTAAVRGEESMHPGDVGAQLDETLLNLNHVLAAARAQRLSAADETRAAFAAPSDGFLRMRVYVARPADRGFVRSEIARRFPDLTSVELVHAEVCRPELLVEIEGVAEI